MLTQRSQVAVEIEAVEGTAETLVAADAFLAYNPSFKPNIEATERDPVRSSLSQHPSAMGKRSAVVGFDVELMGTAAAGDALDISDALKACGVSETLVAVTSATYKPASESIPSVTVGVFVDGKSYVCSGARGNAKLVLEVGKPGIIHFEFQCADYVEADAALLAAVTYSAIIPPVFQGATFTIDSYAGTISKLEIDLGNDLFLRPDANASSGHKSAVITNRKPKLSIDPENVLIATEDYLGNWQTGTLMALSTVLGSAAGNTITITAPKVQYQDISIGERNGLSVHEISALLCLNSGDDEWQIAVT